MIGPLLYALAFAVQPEPLPETFRSCFAGDDGARTAPGGAVPAGRLQEVGRAFSSARSYRACFSSISLFQGAAWGIVEFQGPDRLRWRVRYRGRQDSDPVGELEAIRVGAESWLRIDGKWKPLPAGRKLADAVPSPAWLPHPEEMSSALFEAGSRFRVVGSAQAKAGTCEVWEKTRPSVGPSVSERVCVGARDRRLHRVNAGGPGIEAYWQLELFDYDAPVAIGPPK
jgi:hypothetical protein